MSADVDTLADTEVSADVDTESLAEADTLVDADTDSETDVLTEADALVDPNSEGNVLAEVDVLVNSDVALETDSLTELFGEADSEGDVLGDVESFSVLVKSAPRMTAVLPDGVVTVALPLSSTTTVEPGLTALTLSSMAFFSSGVKASGLDTTVLSAGLTMSLPAFGFVAASPVLVKSAPGMTAVLPDGVVTVALPLSSTTTVEPGLTALTLSSMAFFSSGVKASGLDTTVLSAGVFIEVLVEIDVLPSVEVDALADSDADMLAEIDSDSTLETDSDADVLAEADSDSILDADVDVEVITEVI